MRVGNLPGIRRLPVYLDILRKFERDGVRTTSAPMLAEAAGWVAPVVRKDIEMTGAAGITGVGYPVAELIGTIEAFLGWDHPPDAFLAGAGHLGTAILGHAEFRRQGLNIVAAFDADPAVIGRTIHGIQVLPLDGMSALAQRMHIGLGVLTVPSAHAQSVAEQFVAAGITRIWSFAAPILSLPPGITVQREDLSAGLAELLVRATGRIRLPSPKQS